MATITAIDAATHDRLLAIVSHLPHVLANVLVAAALTPLLERAGVARGHDRIALGEAT